MNQSRITIYNPDSGGVLKPNADGSLPIGGVLAHDAPVTDNPVRIGAVARNTQQAAVGNNDAVNLIATLGGVLLMHPYAPPELSWTYAAAASGIVNTTTAVTIKAAAGGGIRNYITAFQLFSEALTNATEFVIRDGAAGTVIWRWKIPTTGLLNGLVVDLPTPLAGSAATLLEICTLTASGAGAVYFNARGYTGP